MRRPHAFETRSPLFDYAQLGTRMTSKAFSSLFQTLGAALAHLSTLRGLEAYALACGERASFRYYDAQSPHRQPIEAAAGEILQVLERSFAPMFEYLCPH